MYKILKAEKLAEKIYLMDVEAPRVSAHCQPGQFVIVKLIECGVSCILLLCECCKEVFFVRVRYE